MAHLQPATRTVKERPQEEMEPATFKQVTGPGQEELAPVQMVRLRSTHSVHESIIEFQNVSQVPVRAVWMDFAGNEVGYTVIEPKTKRRYRTYISHPWIIRDVASGSRMMLNDSMVIVASAAEHRVVISLPPQLEWKLSTHQFYPAEFKATVKALLLAHRRVQAAPGLCTTASPFTFPDPRMLLPAEPLVTPLVTPLGTLQPHVHQQPPRTLFGQGCCGGRAGGLMPTASCCSSLDLMEVEGPAATVECGAMMQSCVDALYSSTASITMGQSTATTAPSLISSLSSSLADMVGMDTDMTDGGASSSAPSFVNAPSPLSSLPASTQASYQHLAPLGGMLPPVQPQHPAATLAQAGSGALQGLFGEQHQLFGGEVGFGGFHVHAPVATAAPAVSAAPPMSPRTFHKAARMLGWVVEKVVHVVKSPMRSATHPRLPPMPASPMTRKRQASSHEHVMPLLERMEMLPEHLVLHIVQLMAPTDVMQCITRGPAAAHPDIAPAMLQSDPATWPTVAAPPQELAQQQQGQQPMQQ